MRWLRLAWLVAAAVAAVVAALALVLVSRGGGELGGEVEEVLREAEGRGLKPVPRGPVPLRGKACWVWGSTFREYGVDYVLDRMAELGIRHAFVLVKGVSGEVVKSVIAEVLPRAHERGIYVHAWVVCFVDRSRPGASPDSYEYRKYLLEVILDFLTLNASGHFVDGIHLDYVRYGGFASNKWQRVSSFVREVRELIDRFAPGAVLSVASKAEAYGSKAELLESALFYGQNYEDLAKYVDLFCPMTYYLDYNVPPSLVGLAAKWVKEATGRAVFAGIQLHPSEHPSTRGREPEPREVEGCLRSCAEGGADGVAFFRFGIVLAKWGKYAAIIRGFELRP